MSPESKRKLNLSVILGLLTIIIFMGISIIRKDIAEGAGNLVADVLPTDGTPVLILQNRVGDDATLIIHQTWCQLLPYKRNIQDNRVFCYVEVIDDWVAE